MENEKKAKKQAHDVWDAQGMTSFCKATNDWFSQTYSSRLHLSFVKHNGRDNGCKQLSHIEVGIPMLKAGSDGQGESGITALQLAADIRSGRIQKKAAQLVQNQKSNVDVFACIGGTPSKRSKNGEPAEFRRFGIAPSKTVGQYVFKASRCEGEDSATGGVQPKKGATWETIMVRVTEPQLQTFAEYILSEWTAFRTAVRMQELLSGMQAQPAPKNEDSSQAPKNEAATSKTPQPAKEELPAAVYVVMDTATGIQGAAVTAASALAMVRTATRKLQSQGFRIVSDEDAKKMADRIVQEENNSNRAQWYSFELISSDKKECRVGVQVVAMRK